MDSTDETEINNSKRNETFEYNYTITQANNDEEIQRELYKFLIPGLLLFCLISLLINVRVLLAVHWVRRPLSPTLHISLSLAAADACTSALLITAFLVSSYLPVVYGLHSSCYFVLPTEMLKMDGVIITVAHLLALSVNHWLGILKPFHYTTLMTSTKVISLIVALWIVPSLFFAVCFLANDIDCESHFITKSQFRKIFVSLLLIPLLLMACFYTHILYIVRKQQKIWAELSRSGSQRIRGHNRPSSQQRRTMEGNVKAVHTTLLILGSCVVGWMPASLLFVLLCQEGCVFLISDFEMTIKTKVLLSWSVNMLVVLKTLVNPIIYSARMVEIKDGMRRMELAASRIFCNSQPRENYNSNLYHQQLAYSGSINHGVTALCRFNGSTTQRSIRSHYPNTLV